ncbi:MAG: hypothetical protein U1E26_04890 [Coriobacteriia bacterium]|nr:hypothetical protein [Coriobacteriia bacterium]
MEFSVTCPIDGVVEVGLEDIDTVVLRESDRADITFVCPHCGTQIGITAVVPAFLLAAIEALAEEAGGLPSEARIVVTAVEDVANLAPRVDDPSADAYCEYFRRQLEHVDCVDDALDEIDSKNAPAG